MVLEQQLHATRGAYAIGRMKQTIEISDATLQLGLEQEWRALLSDSEQEQLDQCAYYRTAALQAARQGKYSVADYLFSAESKYIQTHTFSPVGALIAQSMHESAVAYLDYREARFERGTARLYQALACDETLETTYGCISFHLHRIRLLLNLVRLKRRLGATCEALHMSFALADYLEQKISSLPFPTIWDSSCLKYLPHSPQNFLFEQAIFEIVFLVAGQKETSADFLHGLREHTNSIPCQFSLHAHSWLQARLALEEACPDRFLALIHPLLLAGPAEIYWLWHGILIDLVLLLSKEGSLGEAHLLLQDIAQDMSAWKWPSLPSPWKMIHQQLSAYMCV